MCCSRAPWRRWETKAMMNESPSSSPALVTPAEHQPSAWLTVDLPVVARHVLVVRRRRLRAVLAVVAGGLRGRRDRLAREWWRLRREIATHLAVERAWLGRTAEMPTPTQVAMAAREHEGLLDAYTGWRARLEAEGGERWRTLRLAVRRLGRELEEQIYCEQVLLFPRLRAFRAIARDAIQEGET